ncbi:hypothetical protein BC827DRAFT_261624 [Russula dissimulans]|nr:hypothetical protein BC827DRAFT_261624 [Russula dissimulans]
MMHGHSDEEAQSRSDASSHGMGNIADTEMDVDPSGTSVAENTRQAREKHSDGAAPSPTTPPQPTKKKRTRTLTTPQQSAVLHALLAQSRFPTTAMREEVGRSIGLSARKVQVWFQNQRQKARRPRNQGSAAPARPPQYGGFSNASAPSLASSTHIPSSLSSDEGHTPFYAAPSAPFIQFSVNREYSSHESVFGSSVSGTSPSSSSGGGHLSGPGVPGTGSSFAPRFPPITHSIPPHPAPTLLDHSPSRIPRDIAHPTSMRQAPSSRDFTFNHPHHLPPLHVPETGGYGGQGQYLSFPLTSSYHDHHHPHLGSLSHSLSRPRSQQRHSFPSPSSSSSSPQTPGTSLFLVPHSRLEPTRDLPRLQIPPLHVPESPHAHAHAQQQQRSAVRYSPPRDSVRFSQPSERALLPATTTSDSTPVSSVSATFRGEGSESPPGPASTPSRAKRFDPVREAASECSGSQGTNTPTP